MHFINYATHYGPTILTPFHLIQADASQVKTWCQKLKSVSARCSNTTTQSGRQDASIEVPTIISRVTGPTVWCYRIRRLQVICYSIRLYHNSNYMWLVYLGGRWYVCNPTSCATNDKVKRMVYAFHKWCHPLWAYYTDTIPLDPSRCITSGDMVPEVEVCERSMFEYNNTKWKTGCQHRSSDNNQQSDRTHSVVLPYPTFTSHLLFDTFISQFQLHVVDVSRGQMIRL